MTDLPRCKLCQCEPNQSLSLADPGFRYNCDSHDCPIAESGLTLTREQWTALMCVDRTEDLIRIDRAYLDGLKAGWNYGIDEDVARYEGSVRSYTRQIKEAKGEQQ